MADTAEPKQLTAATVLATPILSGEIHAEPCRHLHVYAAPQCGARKTDPLIVPRPARRRRDSVFTSLPDAARALRQAQVTFDGMRETHDKRRHFISKVDSQRSSFVEASSLVSTLVRLCRVDIRFNV